MSKEFAILFQCLMHTWSTSAEFQLLFIAVALAYTYSRSHRAGLAFNIFLVVSGLVYNFFTVYSKRLQGVIYQMPIHLDNLVNTGNYLHLNTLSHVYSYFMVFLAQYLAEHCKTLSLNRVKPSQPFLKITKIVVFIYL